MVSRSAKSPALPSAPDLLGGLAGLVVNAQVAQVALSKSQEEAQRLGPPAGQVALHQATKLYSEATHAVNGLKDAMAKLVVEAHKIHNELQTFLQGKDTTVGHLCDLLARKLDKVYREIRDKVMDPLPEERGERIKARARLITRIMEEIGRVYGHVMVGAGIPRERAESQFNSISPMIVRVLLVAGNIIDNHPVLLDVIIFAVTMLLLPEIPILRPILSMLGFGPSDPVEGSPAALLQSKLWGGSVSHGSWFAILQKTGMAPNDSWLQRLVTPVGLAAVLGPVASKL